MIRETSKKKKGHLTIPWYSWTRSKRRSIQIGIIKEKCERFYNCDWISCRICVFITLLKQYLCLFSLLLFLILRRIYHLPLKYYSQENRKIPAINTAILKKNYFYIFIVICFICYYGFVFLKPSLCRLSLNYSRWCICNVEVLGILNNLYLMIC